MEVFQDLCAQICEDYFKRPVSLYREAQDGGQDAVFLLPVDSVYIEATVQCKFSGKPERRLKLGDITSELDSVAELVIAGRAKAYYLITNMGVDAPVAAKIKDELRNKGVEEPEVFGKEWITTRIRESAVLRALVPRVYGLGDLSTIIDERAASQTRALLGHLLPSLKLYVPTAAHRTAVRTLDEHKLVLLLGAPAVGKSMLAAILATMAVDINDIECLKSDGPLNLNAYWNPHETKRLFWVDDAFGPNQLRDDYVDAWIEFMPKMKAAIDLGCHFILTSRTHIWKEAKLKLGTRNHILLQTEKAVVNVGTLSPAERQQILYNYIKDCKHPKAWKELVKPYLKAMSDESSLLPEIARRLGDPIYTAGIKKYPEDLLSFIHKPQEFLESTIQELSDAHQAAMTLVFLSRSRLAVTVIVDEFQLVSDKYGISVSAIAKALEQLNGAFLILRQEQEKQYWSFVHPTFADAISKLLSARADLVELYLRGVKIDTLLSEAACEGAVPVNDAVLIPVSSSETLITRLLETPNEKQSNEKLFQFLNRRASNDVISRLLFLDPRLPARKGSPNQWSKVIRHAEIIFRAKANSMNMLNNDIREFTCSMLDEFVSEKFDLSFLSDEKFLQLFSPHELIKLVLKVADMLENRISEEILNIRSSADPDSDIDDQFEHVQSFIDDAQLLGEYNETLSCKINELLEEIDSAKDEINTHRSTSEEESFFSHVLTSASSEKTGTRSIFSDIDE